MKHYFHGFLYFVQLFTSIIQTEHILHILHIFPLQSPRVTKKTIKTTIVLLEREKVIKAEWDFPLQSPRVIKNQIYKKK